MLRWRCTAAASATMQLRISFTSTWGGYGAGNWVPDLRVGVTLSQRRSQASIVSVYVVAKMDFTVFVGESCPVHNEDRYALGQVDGDIVLSALHSLLHLFQRPSRIISQCPRGQLGRLFDANASMTEIPARA